MKNEITAKRLQLAMNNIGITAQELSNKSGVAKASISQYVNGSHKPSNISSGKLSKILDVNPLWLMGFDVPIENNQIEPTLYVAEPSSYDATFTKLLSPDEEEIVKKYRVLDERGKEMVKSVLEQAYISRPRMLPGQLTFFPGKDRTPYSNTEVKAAHNDSTDPAEIEKMMQDLENLKRPE